MESYVCRVRMGVLLVALAALAVFSGACGTAAEPEGNQALVISSIEAEHLNVYPRAASQVECIVSNPDGDEVQFKWSCTGGSLSGDGSVVTWEAPNSYGDYHIMVIVEDNEGESTQGTLILSVVPRPSSEGCCGR